MAKLDDIDPDSNDGQSDAEDRSASRGRDPGVSLPRSDEATVAVASFRDAITVVGRTGESDAGPARIPASLQGIRAYELLESIGGGGMGVVYRARDIERDQIVALKTLSHVAIEGFADLKQEFRAAADIAHENLVTLHELLFENGVPYFTMELVEGTDFVSYVRGKERAVAPLDEPALERLRRSARQLAIGVSVLHRAGKLHRDLKPTNVMVTPEGRVVILDFGLALDADPEAFDHRVVGTPAYMAPEQTSGLPIGTAADWYAVGVILYRALTGELPFGRTVSELVRAMVDEPPRPTRVVAAVPPDLDDLCAHLLQQNPERRPSGAEVLERLGASAPAPAIATPVSAPLVGREAELASLDRAFADVAAGATVLVRVEAPSGTGKTALVRHWLDRAAGTALVLSSRCRERESFSFKAFDGVIDDLVEALRERPATELASWLGDDDALFRLFPSLGQLPLSREAPAGPIDPHTLRRRAFRALVRLLARLAREQPLVLFIDDLQWSDSDSADLLAELLAPPRPQRVLFIAAARSESTRTTRPGFRRVIDSAPGLDRRELVLGRLSDEACAELARATVTGVAGAAAGMGPEDLSIVARESLGNPLLLEQLVRDALASGAARTSRAEVGALSLQDVVLGRVGRLSNDARRMLEVVAVAGRPIPQRIAFEIASPSVDPWAVVAVLRVESLVRTHGARGREQLEAWHDGIRESVADHLSPAARAGYHAALAEALEREAARGEGRIDAGQLATHFHGAGQLDKAGRYALKAARLASETLAFERAASLYALARTCGAGDATQLLRLEADALVNGGMCAQAAPLYHAAAASSAPDEAHELQRLAAEQLLVSGRVDEGVAELGPLLGAVGLRYPRTPVQATASVLWQLGKLALRRGDFAFEAQAEPDPRLLRQIDLCWSAGKGLVSFDSLRGAHFLLRMLSLSLKAGDPHRASRALAMVGMMTVFAGDAASHRKGTRVLEQAERAAPPGDAYLEGMITLCRGTAEMSIGRFVRGMELLERGIEKLERDCTSIRWECSAGRSSIFTSLIWIGDIAEISARAARYRRNAEQIGDLFLAVTAELYGAVALLAQGDPAAAREATRSAIRRWAQDGYHYQHWLAAKVTIWCDLYEGDAAGATAHCDEAMRRVRRAGLLRVGLMEIDALLLEGRVAVAAARATSSRRRRARLRQAQSNARRLDRLDRPLAAAGAAHLAAQIALVEGTPERARSSFADAADRFAEAEAGMHSLVARRLAGAPEAVDEQIRARGVADAPRWCQIYAESP